MPTLGWRSVSLGCAVKDASKKSYFKKLIVIGVWLLYMLC